MKNWVERQRNIIEFLLSILLKKKGKNLALLLVYSLVVFLIGSVMLFSTSVREEALFLFNDAPEMVLQKRTAGRHDLLSSHYAEKIAEMEEVGPVRSRLWGYSYDPVTGANYTLIVPETIDPGEGNIIIGEGVSRTRLVFEDDVMEFKNSRGDFVNYHVKEILPSGSERVSSDLVLMSAGDFRKLFNIPNNYYTDLTIQVRDPAKRAEIAGRIRKLFPETALISKDEILGTYHHSMSWRRGIKVIVLAGMLLALLILAWDKASGLSEEEKKEIGILKAIGWQRTDLLLMKFWEGFGISLSSFLLGLLFAYFHVFFTDSALFEPILKGWAVLYPDFKLVPFLDPLQIFALFLLALLPYTFATVLPVWRAMDIDPDAALRA
jgi:ABC-type lipoprotein release transport system permease subunit